MAELFPLLQQAIVIPRVFQTSFMGPIDRAKILTAVTSSLPLPRNCSFIVKNGLTDAWYVTYDFDSDEYWTEKLDLAA